MSHWQNIQINNKLYLFKYYLLSNNNKIKYFLCDLTDMWHEEVTINNFNSRARNENQHIEDIDNATILKTLTSVAENYQLKSSDDDDTKFECILNVKYYICKIPFKFHWNLVKASNKCFLEEITLPLITQIAMLQLNITNLKEIILKKDTEIEMYKQEGASLKRKNFETIKFDDNAVKPNTEDLNCFFNDILNTDNTNCLLTACNVNNEILHRKSTSLAVNNLIKTKTSPSGSKRLRPNEFSLLISPNKSIKQKAANKDEDASDENETKCSTNETILSMKKGNNDNKIKARKQLNL